MERKRSTLRYKLAMTGFAIILCFSIYCIIDWCIDNYKIKQQEEYLSDTEVKDVTDSDDTEIIQQEEEVDEFNPYWDYINMNLIEVDFNELKEINKYTSGWIQINGTNINYPYVQAYNNEYFLDHDFNNESNNAGWLFMDYRNDSINFDKNTIIYGHARYDNSMFGTLKNILDNGWYDDKDNHIIRISTEYENTMWQVFSVYHIPETSDYIQVDFRDYKDYQSFIDLISNRTMLEFDTSVNVNDKILTLSTCYGTSDSERLVVHAKLIKREQR